MAILFFTTSLVVWDTHPKIIQGGWYDGIQFKLHDFKVEWILWSAIEGLTEISLFKKCISRIKAEESHERDAAITLFQDLLYLVPMSSFVWKTLIIML